MDAQPQPQRTPTGQFAPGSSGNPFGRPPKGRSAAEIIRDLGNRPYRDTPQTYRERAYSVLWEQAASGDHKAAAWLTERGEGKLTERVEHIESVGVLGDFDLSRLSEDEIRTIAASLNRARREPSDAPLAPDA